MEKIEFEKVLLEEIRKNRSEISDLKDLVYAENTDIRKDMSSFKLKFTGGMTIIFGIITTIIELWRGEQ